MKLVDRIENAMYQAKQSYSNGRLFDIFHSKYGNFKVLKYKRQWGSICALVVEVPLGMKSHPFIEDPSSLVSGKKHVILERQITNGKNTCGRILEFIHDTCGDRKIMKEFGFEPLDFFRYQCNDFKATIEREYYVDYGDFVVESDKNWVDDENTIEVTFYLKGKELCCCWSEDLRKTLKEFCALNYLDMNQTIRDKLILEGVRA